MTEIEQTRSSRQFARPSASRAHEAGERAGTGVCFDFNELSKCAVAGSRLPDVIAPSTYRASWSPSHAPRICQEPVDSLGLYHREEISPRQTEETARRVVTPAS